MAFHFADLPPPPAFERWVLEQPLPLAVACLATGVGVCITLVRRSEARRGAVFGGLLGLAAAAVFLTGFFITTQRERLVGLTSEFVRRAIAADGDWAEHRISDRLVVASAGEIYHGFGKQALVDAIRGFDAFQTREWSERSRGAVIDGEGLARTQATVTIQGGYIQSLRAPSTWEFTWSRAGADDWLLTRLECLTMWGEPPRVNWESSARAFGRHQPGRQPGIGALKRETN